MKNKSMLLLAVVMSLGLSNCASETYVIEVPRTYTPVAKPKPAPKPPTPEQFGVVNQYDSDAR